MDMLQIDKKCGIGERTRVTSNGFFRADKKQRYTNDRKQFMKRRLRLVVEAKKGHFGGNKTNYASQFLIVFGPNTVTALFICAV